MVDELVEQGVAGAKSLKHGVDNIDNYLSACQLGITICSIGLGITAEPVVKDWFVAPKSLAIARTRQTGRVLVPPMRIFYLDTKPVVDLFNWLGNVVLQPFGIPPATEAQHDAYTEPELLSVITASRRRGELGGTEARFAHGAFAFGDRRARAR